MAQERVTETMSDEEKAAARAAVAAEAPQRAATAAAEARRLLALGDPEAAEQVLLHAYHDGTPAVELFVRGGPP
jgi:hypothetical protein